MKRIGLLLLALGTTLVLSLVSINQELLFHASADSPLDDTPDLVRPITRFTFLPRVVVDFNSAGAETKPEYAEEIAKWKEVNDDVIGFIDMPEFEISYPVLQGETNKTYLRTNIYNEYDVAGCIFLDSNYPDIYSPVKLIHGHYMQDKTMFGRIPELLFFETLDDAPRIFYTDDLGTKEFKVFSVFTVNSAEESVIVTQFPMMDEMEEHIAEYLDRSWVSVSEGPSSTELLMLDTCWYGFSGKEHNLHCIVVASRV